MNIRERNKEFINKYIEDNGLKESYIKPEELWRYRSVLPEVKMVGKDENGNKIFFEETSGSLAKRHYGKFDKANSFNLCVFNGAETKLVTNDYLATAKIEFNEGYNLEMLSNFINNKNKRYNPLKHAKRIKCSFYLTEEEIELVKKFVERIREIYDEDN